MRWPAPGEPSFSFSKSASAKKMAFWTSLKELSSVSREVAVAKARFDPEEWQK
jgi:hypothetical protein